jgi:hypothetical protein
MGRMIKKAVQQGRSERKAEAYVFQYVEALSDARTKLAAFFSILLAPECFLIHMLFHRHLGEGPPIVALVAADAPFLDPLVLHVGLAAFGADKDAFFVEHHPFFFHGGRIAHPATRLQAG